MLARGYHVAVTHGPECRSRSREPRRRSQPLRTVNALALRLDVTDPSQVAESSARCRETFRRGIDVLVNNAGIGYFAAVEESDEAEVRRMLEINFFGMARMTRAILPGMRKRYA